MNDPLEMKHILLITIDRALYHISDLEEQEISKEKDDRCKLGRIEEIMNTIEAIKAEVQQIAGQRNYIMEKYQRFHEFYEGIKNPKILPAFSPDLVTDRASLELKVPIQCLEIGDIKSHSLSLRKGYRFGIGAKDLCKSERNSSYTEVSITFYTGESLRDCNPFYLESRILSYLSEKKRVFLVYYGAYTSEETGEHRAPEFGIVYEKCKNTLKSDLDQRKKSKTKYTSQELKRICRMLIVALDYMHSFKDAEEPCLQNGIHHLDICPENVFFTADGLVKLGNFNVLLSGYVQPLRSQINKMCKDYMSPELVSSLKGERVRFLKSKADVYSFGLTMLETATLEDVAKAGLDERLGFIEKIEVQEVREMVRKCLDRNEAARPSFKDLKVLINNLEIR